MNFIHFLISYWCNDITQLLFEFIFLSNIWKEKDISAFFWSTIAIASLFTILINFASSKLDLSKFLNKSWNKANKSKSLFLNPCSRYSSEISSWNSKSEYDAKLIPIRQWTRYTRWVNKRIVNKSTGDQKLISLFDFKYQQSSLFVLSFSIEA